MDSGNMLYRVLVFSAIFAVSTAQTPAKFICGSTSTCRSLIDYLPSNATTISAVQSLFGVEHLSLLGANNLPENTSSSTPLPALQKVKIPLRCKCGNGTGVSDGHPIYKVQSEDTLSKIADVTFSRLVTYQQIAAANGIPDPDKILLGQNLTIPLPCSCDEVDGNRVIHYAHLVEGGSSVSSIAAKYNVSEETILKLNGIANAKDLKASQVLDIPLKACSSVVRETSLDNPFLLANDTYEFTANNCVMCKCDAMKNWILDCKPSQLKPSNWSTCPATQCEGGSLLLGNSTSSGCNTRTCAYAGFSKDDIFTDIATHSTCPDNPNSASRIGSRGLSLAYIAVVCMHLLGYGLLLI